MYQIINSINQEILAEVDKVIYLKWRDDAKCWIEPKNHKDAQCIFYDGIRYSLLGKDLVEDAPVTVYVREVDNATAHFQTAKKVDITSRDLADIAWGMQKMAEEIVAALESQQDA